MTTLVLPIAGRSTRFPGSQPKWSLRWGPDDLPMLVHAVKGLVGWGQTIMSVLVVGIEENRDLTMDVVAELMALYEYVPVNVVLLRDTPRGQALTVAEGIKAAAVTGSIFVKDCDNYFEMIVRHGGNYVATGDLNEERSVTPWNKSYVVADSNGHLTAIAEKTVLSANFCVGGYGFDSAELFCREASRASDVLLANKSSAEVFPSTVIFNRLLKGELFQMQRVLAYADWGTTEDWNAYTAKERDGSK